MKNKVLMLCGILAPVVYVLTVILGGAIRPGYSHVAQAVSDLIATSAPNKSILDSLFALYNILTIAFGLGLFQHMRTENQNRGKVVGTLGALVLVAEGIFGFITLFFPEDAGGMSAAITSTGTLHIVFAGLSSLTTMLAILLVGFWFRNSQRLRGYGLYSFLSVAAVFLSGGLAAISVANQSPIGGLVERITIGGFLQTILPNFLAMGILTVILGLLIVIWSAAFVQRKNGGGILILLSVALLLFGGGFFPPIIGLIGGAAGTRINKPLAGKSAGSILRFAEKLWPWPLVIFMVWVLGQFLVGYFFNDFLKNIMGLGLLLILVMQPLSVYTAYAHDAHTAL